MSRRRTHFLSLDQRKQIKEMIDEQIPMSVIATKIKKQKSFIYREIIQNGGRDNYNPETAHENCLYPPLPSNYRIRDLIENCEVMEKKIENLEMQMEILIDTIKEIKEQYDSKN